MTRGPKLVQVVSSLCIGGAERAAIELAAGLGERGFESELWVVSPTSASGPADEARFQAAELARRGVPVRRLVLDSIRRRRDRGRLQGALREQRVALVNVHNRPIDWQVVLLARAAGVAAVYTRQLGYDDVSARQRVVYRAAGRAASAVVALTDAVARHVERIERVSRRKLVVIPDGIDTARYRPPRGDERLRKRAELGLDSDSFLWIAAARLVRQKGLGFLLEGMARQAPSGSRLLLAGDGPDAAALRTRCMALGLTDRVRFLGPRDDVDELLRAADGYVCTSLGEGQGLSLVEALASGLPVVAPRLGCVGELGGAGFVHFGPEIEAWAADHEPRAIAAAMDAVERGRGGADAAEARRNVETRFSTRAMLDGYEALYRRILAAPAGPRAAAAAIGRRPGRSRSRSRSEVPTPSAGSCDIPPV